MKIIVLTPIYATTTAATNGTPVVHYFVKEWVKMGHKVTVFHLQAKYPKFFYWFSKRFNNMMDTRLGIRVPLDYPTDEDYEAEGVTVHRRCLEKVIPHSRYKKSKLDYAVNLIKKDCERNGIPDYFVGHWDNPELELLCALKKIFGNPICLVLHGTEYNFEEKYGEEGMKMLSQLDVIGFRSMAGRANFINKYGMPKKSFVASSGVAANFLAAGAITKRVFKRPFQSFIYVGALISRKFPASIIPALTKAYPDGHFTMTYIGDGAEKANIEEEHSKCGNVGKLHFTGLIPRDEIIDYLKQSDVFIMISKNETFGLVYLEAMAFGMIVIGSRNEGIDGVIRDGENGFLCESGNTEELAELLKRINGMPEEMLYQISKRAQETASEYSDYRVAERYIDALNNKE